MTAEESIPIMVQRIVEGFNPVRIILFGSQARGDARPDSDVDLLIVLDRVEDKRKAAIVVRSLLASSPVPKDIVITTPDEIIRRGHVIGTILRPALQEGKVVYERSRAVA